MITNPKRGLYARSDGSFHSEGLVSWVRSTGVLGGLSSEIDPLAPFPCFRERKVDDKHTELKCGISQ